MAKKTGKPWTMAELERLRELARENLTTTEIAQALGRSYDAIRIKAEEEGIPLRSSGPRPPPRRK